MNEELALTASSTLNLKEEFARSRDAWNILDQFVLNAVLLSICRLMEGANSEIASIGTKRAAWFARKDSSFKTDNALLKSHLSVNDNR